MKRAAAWTKTELQALLAKRPDMAPDEMQPALRAGAPPACVSPGNGAQEPVRAQRRKKMNKTETEFSLILDRMVKGGEISHFGFEELTLRWGTVDPISYTPDFTVIGNDLATFRVKFIEVKGAHIRNANAALQKFKAARNEFAHCPWYVFELWQKKDRQWTRLY